MAKWLTRGERERIHVSSYFPDYLRAWCDDPKNILNREQKRLFRTASTLMEKVIIDFVSGLDPDYAKKLRSDIENYDLHMEPKRVTTRPEEVRLNRDDFYEIVARAIVYSCRKQADGSKCEHKGNYKRCFFYQALINTASPVFDPEREKDCPYRIE